MAIRKTRSQWLALFQEQQESGFSVAKFCQQKQMSEAYFYLKRKKLGSNEGELSNFVSARSETVLPGSSVTLQFGQCELQLTTDTNSQWLASLMKSLS